MTCTTAVVKIFLICNFSDNVQLDPKIWDYNHWAAVNNPSFYGRTQMEQYLPHVDNGVLDMTIQTFFLGNKGKYFSGSEIISKQCFGINIKGCLGVSKSGIAFTARARLVKPFSGMVGGLFSYNYNNIFKLDNETDVELLSNVATGADNTVQTNVYANEPLGPGHWEWDPDSNLAAFHVYTVEWFPPSQVIWFVDGKQVRQESNWVPSGSMPFHVNFWVPDTTWAAAYSSKLHAAQNSSENATYHFYVSNIEISEVPIPEGK